MAVSALFIGADVDIKYEGAVPENGGAYLNAGTCTWVLKNASGATVGSGSLAYVASSNGNYLGTIQSTTTSTLTVDDPYTLTITFSQGDYNDQRTIPMRAAYRTTA